jgi:glycosyltransferase involved in cell wall biosynthesis
MMPHGEAALTDAPRVAIACSGLGHVRRGIEAWAEDLGAALLRRGVPAVLFGAGGPPPLVRVPCLQRDGATARTLSGLARHAGGWRYGMGSTYEVEQSSFALPLWRQVRSGFDVLHVQDPLIARILQRLHRAGLSRPRVILANGTGEAPQVLRGFDHLQFLTPAAAQRWQARPGQSVFAVPNFIDVDRFTPGDQAAARARLGLPPEGAVFLCCAAIKRHHKRIDALLQAFAAAVPDATLVIAGGREAETEAVIALGRALLGDRVRFLPDFPRAEMPTLYRAADAFLLASLFETFGIVLLEAMATGLPVLVHDTEDFRHVVGPAGLVRDLATPDSFAAALRAFADPALLAPLAAAARPHVTAHFSEPFVVDQILAMYRDVGQKFFASFSQESSASFLRTKESKRFFFEKKKQKTFTHLN